MSGSSASGGARDPGVGAAAGAIGDQGGFDREEHGRDDGRMIADHLTGIEQFEAELWKVADGLRANSNLASNEYFMPILGLIFLRHATNRYYAALGSHQGGQGRRQNA